MFFILVLEILIKTKNYIDKLLVLMYNENCNFKIAKKIKLDWRRTT